MKENDKEPTVEVSNIPPSKDAAEGSLVMEVGDLAQPQGKPSIENFSARFSKLHSFLDLVEQEHDSFYGEVCRELRDLFPEGRRRG